MLLAVHAEQSGSQPALGRIPRSTNGEELRVIRGAVTQNLVVELRSERKIDTLALIFQSGDVSMSSLQLSHAGDRIVREVKQATTGNWQGFVGTVSQNQISHFITSIQAAGKESVPIREIRQWRLLPRSVSRS